VVQGEKYAINPGRTQQQKEEPTGWRIPRWKERLERDESSEALEAVRAITVSRYRRRVELSVNKELHTCMYLHNLFCFFLE
jgi:hypothetical protein